MLDRERIEKLRLQQRVGQFYKHMDHTKIYNPDPRSGHYMAGKSLFIDQSQDEERYDKDYAAYDKRVRDQQSQLRRQLIDQKRVQKYERDLNRWEFMDSEMQRED